LNANYFLLSLTKNILEINSISKMYNYAAEFLGTFMFLSVILHATQKNAPWPSLAPLLIVVGLLAAIAFSASSSGAHLNPAVSVMMTLKKALPVSDLLPYVGAQILGGAVALYLFKLMVPSA
jgi:aquaporin Z